MFYYTMKELQTKLAISTSPSKQKLGQPVPMLTPKHQASGRVATGVHIFQSVVKFNPLVVPGSALCAAVNIRQDHRGSLFTNNPRRSVNHLCSQLLFLIEYIAPYPPSPPSPHPSSHQQHTNSCNSPVNE